MRYFIQIISWRGFIQTVLAVTCSRKITLLEALYERALVEVYNNLLNNKKVHCNAMDVSHQRRCMCAFTQFVWQHRGIQPVLTRHDEQEDRSFVNKENRYLDLKKGSLLLSHRSKDMKLKQRKHFKQYPRNTRTPRYLENLNICNFSERN